MILSQIVAVAKNGVIGKNNNLPWSLPEDLKFFREKTQGKVMIMGRKTFESLPAPLKKRYHIVISRTPHDVSKISTIETPVEFVTSLKDALKKAESLLPQWPEEVFIVGGSAVFKEAFPVSDKIYLTRIHHDVDGDVFYPDVDFSQMKLAEKVDRQEPFPFSFLTYTRI